MKKLPNILVGLLIIFFIPIAGAQFFPFSGFSQSNNDPLQQGNYLQLIATYTYGTMERLNTLPSFIESWLKVDKTDATASKFPIFVQLGVPAADPTNTAQQLTKELIGKNIPGDVNDFTYTTLLGKLIKYPDTRSNVPPPDYTFLKTASGGLLSLPPPQSTPGSNSAAQEQYKYVYKTLISAISYNNFLMTKLYNEMKRDDKSISQLIQQSTSEQWLKEIGGKQELGVIFRQMLLYMSQSYVLQARILEMQRETSMSQIFTNTLLILSIQNGLQSITAAASSSATQ